MTALKSCVSEAEWAVLTSTQTTCILPVKVSSLVCVYKQFLDFEVCTAQEWTEATARKLSWLSRLLP